MWSNFGQLRVKLWSTAANMPTNKLLPLTEAASAQQLPQLDGGVPLILWHQGGGQRPRQVPALASTRRSIGGPASSSQVHGSMQRLRRGMRASCAETEQHANISGDTIAKYYQPAAAC